MIFKNQFLGTQRCSALGQGPIRAFRRLAGRVNAREGGSPEGLGPAGAEQG